MRVAVTGTGFLSARLRARLPELGMRLVPLRHAADLVFHTASGAPPPTRARRLVLLSSDAAVQHGQPLVEATETLPRQPHSRSATAAAQARAELRALADPDRETVIVRPRLLWGAGDPRLSRLHAAVALGRFSWVGGGCQPTDTTHVDNAVHALLLAARHGRPGHTYFVSDHDPVAYRHFIADLLAAEGLTAPARTISYRRAHALTALSETTWRTLRLPGPPPLDHLSLWRAGLAGTVDTAKARAHLGYEPVLSRGRGLAELRDETPRGAVHSTLC